MRIGHGYDVHAFCEGSGITLNGIMIPHDKAFKAHSDGDVALHALCDALLGAAGLGDIGRHFPDTEDQYKNIDSRILLREVVALLDDAGMRCNNADITIVAQRPKIGPHIEAMCELLAGDLNIERTRINVSATTSEWLGFTGREEGIAAHAVVTITD